MRHRKKGKKLGRSYDHRRALFKNLIRSLVEYEEIETTEAKAKAVRRIFEKLITKGKDGTVHARRLIHVSLQNRKAVNKLVDKIAPLFKERKGGFTRIVRLGKRKGDNAMMVRLELVRKIKKVKSKPVIKKKSSLSRFKGKIKKRKELAAKISKKVRKKEVKSG